MFTDSDYENTRAYFDWLESHLSKEEKEVAKETAEQLKPYDNINPSHYKNQKIQCIEYIAEQGMEVLKGFCIGNILKYASRVGKKPGADPALDLRKIAWYANTLADYLEGKTPHFKNE